VERLMREDIAPTLEPMDGFDAQAYIDAILARFRNSEIRHRLGQIAWDGSQKIPVRLLGTIGDALAAGRPIDRLCLPIAAWMHVVRRQAQAGNALEDPMAATLASIGATLIGDARQDVTAFLALGTVFDAAGDDAGVVDAIVRAYAALGDATPAEVARALTTA
jgi:fructuronate reductase